MRILHIENTVYPKQLHHVQRMKMNHNKALPFFRTHTVVKESGYKKNKNTHRKNTWVYPKIHRRKHIKIILVKGLICWNSSLKQQANVRILNHCSPNLLWLQNQVRYFHQTPKLFQCRIKGSGVREIIPGIGMNIIYTQAFVLKKKKKVDMVKLCFIYVDYS